MTTLVDVNPASTLLPTPQKVPADISSGAMLHTPVSLPSPPPCESDKAPCSCGQKHKPDDAISDEFSPETKRRKTANRATWNEVVDEASTRAHNDSFMEEIIQKYILDHSSFGSAIAYTLSHEFAGVISVDKWDALFQSVYADHLFYMGTATAESMGLEDLRAIRERDPAADGLVNPFLNFKGFKALQSHRVAHILWHMGRKDTARCIQSRCSELFSVDIHPAAVIGEGLMIDHGTGVVVGETAVIGNNCSFLHGVTLGSTGKDKGDRHPKIGDDVLIGCGTTILGNITIGSCCKIGSGSMVLKPLPSCSTAVGNPAKIVGKSLCPSAAKYMDLALKYVMTYDGKPYDSTFGNEALMI